MIPIELTEMLVQLKNNIESNGYFDYTFRKQLHLLIESLSAKEHKDAGYLRRCRLAIKCAIFSSEKAKQHELLLKDLKNMFNKGVLALQGQYDLKILESENNRLYTSVVDLVEYGEFSYASMYAGMSCFAAINTVLYDVDFELLGVDELTLAPDEWDSSFYGSLALSGSAIWEEKGGDKERVRYWNWFLNEAVPFAWEVNIPIVIDKE